MAAVEREKSGEILNHLKDASRDKKGFGHGAGYLYPHAYRDHWVAQQYLPKSLQGQVFYQPSMQGFEEKINAQVASRREARLAALVEGIGVAPLEILTYGSVDQTTELWLQRTLSQVGTQLATVRDRIFSLTQLQCHHLVLDLNAGSGLLTWEAIRCVPEGGVYACVHTQNDALALMEQAAALPELMRPVILNAQITELPAVLASQTPGVIFDYIIGRNVLFAQSDKASAAQILAKLLPSSGKILLAESIPRHTQRLYRLIEPEKLDKKLYQRLVMAEEAIYSNQSDPMLNWDAFDLQQAFEDAGLTVEVSVEQNTTPIHISSGFIERLFRANANRPSYGERLAQNLTSEEIHSLNEIFMRSLLNQTVSWMSSTAFLKAAYKI